MNQLPPVIRAALSPFAPKASSVQFTEAESIKSDFAVERWKDVHHSRNDRRALELQISDNPTQWGIA